MPHYPPAPPSAFRRVLLAAGALVVVLVGASQLDHLFRGGLNAPLDFAEYWTAGKLNAGGENPYSGANVRAVQRAVGLDDTAIMMWNPPWALTLVMPVGVMPFRAAYGVWVLAQLVLLVAAAELLWRGFGGPPARRWVAHLVALTFGPTVFLIGTGQITGVVLFGLAGFLYFARADRPLLAGACAALAAVKPHLLAPFAVWLLLEATRPAFGRKVVLGGLLVGLAACVPPSVTNPDVWAQYWEAARGPSSADHNHVAVWKPPVLGWWLRQAVPDRPFAAQWLPLAVALVAGAGWWRMHARARWAAELPCVVGVSLVVAPYGAWAFDLVLLLVPVLAVAARLANAPDRRAIAVGVVWLAGVNAVSLVMMANGVSSEWYVWLAPCVLLGCVAGSPTPAPLPKGKGEEDLRDAGTSAESEAASRAVTPFPLGRGAGGVGPSRAPIARGRS